MPSGGPVGPFLAKTEREGSYNPARGFRGVHGRTETRRGQGFTCTDAEPETHEGESRMAWGPREKREREERGREKQERKGLHHS